MEKFELIDSARLNRRDLFWVFVVATHITLGNGLVWYWKCLDPNSRYLTVKDKKEGKEFLPILGNCFYLPNFGRVDGGEYHYGKILWATRCKICQIDFELKDLNEEGKCPKCITAKLLGRKSSERMLPL